MAIRRLLLLLVAAAMVAPFAAGQPATVYEEPDIPPQGMDFDAENNRFRAHSGWIQDKMIHYYKFRMYVPPNYGTDDGGLEKVPIGRLYLPTTNARFDGVPEGQKPILQHHTADGVEYSDFVEIVFVPVTPVYQANTYDSYDDIENMVVARTGIVANVPVVPTGSTLEDPDNPGTSLDQVQPWMAWYKGDEVQTFVFETTDERFANYINPMTRVGDAANAGSGYESVVAPFASPAAVAAIPIWHVNQYQTGVVAGVNNGGPSGVGQRNVIDIDRLQPGYSPLWQVFWATQVPVGYSADQASSASQFAPENGFKIAQTPMYVNCPNIGTHGGGALNTNKVDLFEAVPPAGEAHLEGSIPMQEGVPLSVVVDGKEVAQTTTGMMGLFSYHLRAADAGNRVAFMTEDGSEVAVFDFEGDAPTPVGMVVGAIALLVAVGIARRRA